MKVTIKNVAELAGVSTATVSYVLNNTNRVGDNTRRKVIKAAQELGYQPNALAQGLVKSQTKTIGLVIPHTTEFIFSDPYFPELLKGIGAVLANNGFFLLLSVPGETNQSAQDCSALVKQKRVDGVILVCTPRESQQIEVLKEAELPFVLVGDSHSYSRVASVDVNNEDGSYQMTSYLIKLGHRSLGYISGDMQYDYSVLRYRGFGRALEEKGLEPVGMFMGDFTKRSGKRGALQLLQNHPQITGLVCANDLMAIGAMEAARELGLNVPSDLCIVGFDDIPLAEQISPGLTTVKQPIEDLGIRAAEMLLEGISHRIIPQEKTLLSTELIIRESTRAISKK